MVVSVQKKVLTSALVDTGVLSVSSSGSTLIPEGAVFEPPSSSPLSGGEDDDPSLAATTSCNGGLNVSKLRLKEGVVVSLREVT